MKAGHWSCGAGTQARRPSRALRALRQVGIGAETGRQLATTQQLVKHLPAMQPHSSSASAVTAQNNTCSAGLLLPLVQGLAVMAVVGAGQRQPDIQIR